MVKETSSEKSQGVGANNGLVELLGRALVDSDFRNKLLDDPDKLADEAQLSKMDREALQAVNRDQLEDAASRLGTHSEFRVFIAIGGHFNVTE
jgi:hypothetical protein